MKAKTLETLEEGMVVKGIIKNITEYGAFVDLGGIDGLLHITDMSWGRVNHPNEVFKVGDEVTVKVLKYNAETERVSLGLKQTQEDPVEPRRRGVPAGQEGQRQGACQHHRLRRVRRARAGRRGPHPRERDELDQEGQAPVEAPRDRSGRRVPGARGRLEAQAHLARPQAARARSVELFTEKYHPGDKIGGKVRSITDYGVFVGIEEGVDGMVHKSDLSWTARVNNPATSTTRATTSRRSSSRSTTTRRRSPSASSSSGTIRGRACSPSSRPGKVVEARSCRVVDYGVFVRLRDGVEGLIPQGDVVERRASSEKPLEIGDKVQAEIANIDSQDRRLTLSMRIGEAGSAPLQDERQASRSRRRRRRSAEADKAGGTIGELIKQKLGDKLAAAAASKDEKEEKKDDDEE